MYDHDLYDPLRTFFQTMLWLVPVQFEDINKGFPHKAVEFFLLPFSVILS